jgi:hypothetical protein
MGRVDLLIAHIRKTLGDLGAPLSEEETFEYSSLGLCVVDAVYSIGVRYESTSRTVSDFARWAGWEKNRAKAPRYNARGRSSRLWWLWLRNCF